MYEGPTCEGDGSHTEARHLQQQSHIVPTGSRQSLRHSGSDIALTPGLQHRYRVSSPRITRRCVPNEFTDGRLTVHDPGSRRRLRRPVTDAGHASTDCIHIHLQTDVNSLLSSAGRVPRFIAKALIMKSSERGTPATIRT